MAKILHLGNIANNAYNNAKYLNKYGPHQNEVLNFDNPHIMACPEWEEVDTFKIIDEFNPEWSIHKFAHPDWYHYIETSSLRLDGSISRSSIYTKVTILKRRLAYWLKDIGLKKRGRKLELPVNLHGKLLSTIVLPAFAFIHLLKYAMDWWFHKVAGIGSDRSGYGIISKKLESRLRQYDLIEAYGCDIIIPYLLGLPYIAYEHGTLRELPFDGSERGELLSRAYRNAKYTIITNPDVIESSRKLELKNVIYIPHAVDSERFRPNDYCPLRQKFSLENNLILIAPARQNWDIKGNHKYLHAFAKLLELFPSTTLFVCDWGQHKDLTKQLVKELNINDRVRFYSPLPKLTSLQYYQMADIVLDQFVAGAFGGITPEAMACEKPTLVHYNESVHTWCFKTHPPLINVETEAEILNALVNLAKSKNTRLKIGRRSRRWVKDEYSISQLVNRHNEVFEKVISQDQ